MMACCRLRTLLILAVVSVGLAYIMTVPVPFPAHTNDIWLKYITRVVIRTADFLVNVGNSVGLGTRPQLYRSIMSLQRFMDFSWGLDVREKADVMDGIKVLIFYPGGPKKGLRPGLLYFHGGGWVYQNPEDLAPVCRRLAVETQAVIVSVDYRLAPEHVFPAAIEDAIKVTKHFLKHSLSHGVDPHNIGLTGDSAGGNLAIGTALHLAVLQEPFLPSVKLLGLFYPLMQMLNFKLPSYVTQEHGPGLLTKWRAIDFIVSYLFGNTSLHDAFAENQHTSPTLKKSVHASYLDTKLLPDFVQEEVTSQQSDDFGNETLSNRIESLILDPLLSPIMAPSAQISLLPPTYILIPEFDVLRDEGFLTAARLRGAGVTVQVNYVRGEEHAMFNTIGLNKVAQNTVKHFAQFCAKYT